VSPDRVTARRPTRKHPHGAILEAEPTTASGGSPRCCTPPPACLVPRLATRVPATRTLRSREGEPCLAIALPQIFDGRSVRLADHRRKIRLTVFLLGLVGLIIASRRAVDESRGQVLPDAPALIVAGALTLASIALAARAWTELFGGRHDRRALAGSLYASQLTKYLPAGGFVQAASQVSMTVTAGAGVSHATTAAAVWAFSTVVAGCTLASGLVFAASLPTWLRATALCGLLAPALLHRRALAVALHAAHRLIRRVPDPDVLPTQRRILVSFAWSLGNAVTGSAAYAVLLSGASTDVNPVVVMSAFALSWVVGFLIFPLPSGIGVREAVLVAVVPGASSAALLAASLAQRFLVLASEVAATVGNQVLARRERRASGAPDAAAAGDETAEQSAAQAEHEPHTAHDDRAEHDDHAESVPTSPPSEAR
jgi:glycosyltransferase 2 family protein